MLLVYVLSGTLEFRRGGILPMDANPVLLGVMLLLFVYGFTKAAVMPLHNWLPTAMIAPTPVSALLHAVAVVKAGVFGITRVVVDVFGVDLLASMSMTTVVTVLAAFTILMASVLALAQENLKLRLAYSTVSQLSYVVLGAVLLTPSGMTGGMIQIANHAFAKITLFFCAGAIYVASHKQKISELSGIAKLMPYTMAAFTIGALSLIGVPPLAGFVSKWYLAVGALEAGSISLLLVLLGSTMLNAAYFLPILYKAYFEPAPVLDHGKDGGAHQHGEAPWLCVVPILITAAGTILLGLFPQYFLTLAQIVLGR
jgi:multicomponent Na+:H+ antiporter subunit D